MKSLLAIGLVLSLAAFGVGVSGTRIVVIQPIGALPEGVTAVVAGIPGMRLLDSPDAMCERQQGGVSLLCRASVVSAMGKNGTILLRLPYSETLLRLSGAPEVDR